MNSNIKVAVVDDHVLFAETLALAINNFSGCEVIFKAVNGKEMIGYMENGKIPDIVLLDLKMKEMNGFEVIKYLSKVHPEIHIIINSQYDSDLNIIRLSNMGIKAYLRRDSVISEVELAINSVIAKGFYYPQNIVHKLTKLMRQSEQGMYKHPLLLKENEIKFLRLVPLELTYTEIAKEMYVSPRTVENYRNKVGEKLGIKTRIGLAIYSIKNGIFFL